MVDNEVDRHIEGIKSHDADVRRAAARALGDIGPGAVNAVPELTEALDDEDIDLIAVWALGRIGPDALAAVPAIRRWLDKVDCRCRPVSEIRPQLLYLPEEKQQGLPRMNTAYDGCQVQISKYS
jgi:HEAT repeat protein